MQLNSTNKALETQITHMEMYLLIYMFLVKTKKKYQSHLYAYCCVSVS